MLRKADRQFQLEALEPRVLLSGDGLLAAAIPPASHSDPIPSIQVEENDSNGGIDSSLGYDPSVQIDDIFAGVSGTDIAADSSQGLIPAPPPQEAGNTATSVTAPQAGSVSPEQGQESDPHASGGEAPSNVVSQAEQLTDILRAANAPPAPSGTTMVLGPGGNAAPLGNLVLGSQDTLSGNGTVHGAFVNNGLLSPGHSPGLITVENSFSQGPDGTTLIEVGGTSGTGVNPSGNDFIDVTGNIDLDGTVRIALFNSFIPSAGQSFMIFRWTGTRTGEIANWLGTTGIPGKPDLAFQPIYDDLGKTLRLDVISTPTILPPVATAIQNGLTTLQDVADDLDNIGDFAGSLPLIGGNLKDLVDAGQAVNDVIRNQLTTLLGLIPNQSEITAAIQSWDGASVGGFQVKVKGVLGHYGAGSFWWDVNLEITQTYLNQALTDLTDALLGALFNPNPTVTVKGSLEFDFSFGFDSGFFVGINELTARATVDANGTGGFAIDLAPPGGPLSLNVTNWSVDFDASVTATPDDSVLTGGRITSTTLTNIGNGTINVADAFNLAEAGTVDASMTLTGELDALATGYGVDFTGIHTVRIQSDDLFSGADPDRGRRHFEGSQPDFGWRIHFQEDGHGNGH